MLDEDLKEPRDTLNSSIDDFEENNDMSYDEYSSAGELASDECSSSDTHAINKPEVLELDNIVTVSGSGESMDRIS